MGHIAGKSKKIGTLDWRMRLHIACDCSRFLMLSLAMLIVSLCIYIYILQSEYFWKYQYESNLKGCKALQSLRVMFASQL